MIVCTECDLQYDVTWSNDSGDPPTNYCPRCGSEVELVNLNDLMYSYDTENL